MERINLLPPPPAPVPTPVIETPRLILRPLELADADATQALFPHWEIVQYLSSVPWPYPPDGARAYYKYVALPAMERGEAWHWTLRLKTAPKSPTGAIEAPPGEMIGAIGLMTTENQNRGFWLGLPWHGRGLMSEACAAVNDFWFDVLKFPVLRAPKAIANAASRRMSEKQGMRVVATEERGFVAGRPPSEIWELTADEWRARRASFLAGASS